MFVCSCQNKNNCSLLIKADKPQTIDSAMLHHHKCITILSKLYACLSKDTFMASLQVAPWIWEKQTINSPLIALEMWNHTNIKAECALQLSQCRLVVENSHILALLCWRCGLYNNTKEDAFYQLTLRSMYSHLAPFIRYVPFPNLLSPDRCNNKLKQWLWAWPICCLPH